MKVKDIQMGTHYKAFIKRMNYPTVVPIGIQGGKVQCQIVADDGTVGTVMYRLLPQFIAPLDKVIAKRKKPKRITPLQAAAERKRVNSILNPNPYQKEPPIKEVDPYTVAMILFRGAEGGSDKEVVRDCMNEGLHDAQKIQEFRHCFGSPIRRRGSSRIR